MTRFPPALPTLACVLALALSSATSAADPAPAPSPSPSSALAPEKVAELQHEIDVLGQEVQKLKTGPAASEPIADQGQYGFGPAASKVYRSQPGFTLGGYGEILFESFRSGFDATGRRFAPGEDDVTGTGQNQVDLRRFVLYTGYKFNDNWVLNGEVEWEHGGDEIDVEFLYLDYFWRKELNFRAGNLLMPVGLTNETHEPTTYLGSHRPLLETLIVPTTWSEYGIGVFGDLGPITYRSYFVTGLNATGFTAGTGVEEGRHEKGFVNATRFAYVARADYTGVPGLLPGASFYVGDASTTFVEGVAPVTIPSKIFEAHVQYTWHAFDLRAMGAYSIFSDVDQLDAEKAVAPNASFGSRQGGYYLEAGYDVLHGTGSGSSLTPFLRWETVDTQLEVPAGYTLDGSNLLREVVAGLDFKPIPQLVFKADYQWYLTGDQNGVDQWNLSMGYVF